MKIIIKDVKKIKEGYGKNGKAWTLFRVTDSTGLEYSTFSPVYEAMIGTEVDVDVEVKQNGKYTNRTIVEPGMKKSSQNPETIALLKEINSTLKEILSTLKTPAIVQNSPKQGEINAF